jgi:SAM-dependent methyltransferase
VASETAGAGESRRYHASARRDRGLGPLRPRRADVADIYDQGASAYQALWSPVILPPAAALVRSLGLCGRCVIADIGAGTGALLGPIGSVAPAARVVALDASTRMLCIARTRRGASAVLADALALPLADGTADAVILAYVLFHLADPARAAAEAARVVRPGGRAGIITWAWERQPRSMTCSAPRRRTKSACGVLQTPVTWAPRYVAICTAKVPTPPEAPMIRTCWPGWIPPARRPCSAVTAASGTAAACSKVRFPGLGARLSWSTAMYSAKAPWPKPYTSSPDLNAVTALPARSTVPARSPPGTARRG